MKQAKIELLFIGNVIQQHWLQFFQYGQDNQYKNDHHKLPQAFCYKWKWAEELVSGFSSPIHEACGAWHGRRSYSVPYVTHNFINYYATDSELRDKTMFSPSQ